MAMRTRGWMSVTGVVALAVAVAQLTAVVQVAAAAHASQRPIDTLTLNVSSHPRLGVSYTASGRLYLVGPWTLGVFYDRRACSRSYAAELRRSEGSPRVAGNLTITSVQATYSAPFTFVRYARGAHHLCAYLAHITSGDRYHTDRAVFRHYTLR